MPKKIINENIIEPLATTNYIAVGRNMIKQLGCVEAVILSDLHERYRYWRSQGKDIDNGFYFTSKEMEKELGLTYKQQNLVLKKLESKWYIAIKLIGLPAKRHIYIKDKINEFRIKEPSYNCQKYIYGFDDMCFCNAVFAEPEDMDTSGEVC